MFKGLLHHHFQRYLVLIFLKLRAPSCGPSVLELPDILVRFSPLLPHPTSQSGGKSASYLLDELLILSDSRQR